MTSYVGYTKKDIVKIFFYVDILTIKLKLKKSSQKSDCTK